MPCGSPRDRCGARSCRSGSGRRPRAARRSRARSCRPPRRSRCAGRSRTAPGSGTRARALDERPDARGHARILAVRKRVAGVTCIPSPSRSTWNSNVSDSGVPIVAACTNGKCAMSRKLSIISPAPTRARIGSSAPCVNAGSSASGMSSSSVIGGSGAMNTMPCCSARPAGAVAPRARRHVLGIAERRDLDTAPVGREAPAVVAAAQRRRRRPTRPRAARGDAGTDRRTRRASNRRHRRAGARAPSLRPAIAPDRRARHLVAARHRVPRASQRGIGVREHAGHRTNSLSSAAISSSNRRCSAAFSDVVEPRGVDAVVHELLGDLGRVVVLADEVDVLLADVGVEHRRVVGVQVHEQTGVHHPVDRVRREIGPAVHDRGRRGAAREVDAVVAAARDHGVVFEDVVAVIDPLAAEHVEARR